jgi:hypothetical protein
VALFPAPLVLLNFPSVNYVAHKIQGFTGVVLEKIVECFGLAVSSAKMNIRYKD